jgi:hypothetical protein
VRYCEDGHVVQAPAVSRDAWCGECRSFRTLLPTEPLALAMELRRAATRLEQRDAGNHERMAAIASSNLVASLHVDVAHRIRARARELRRVADDLERKASAA